MKPLDRLVSNVRRVALQRDGAALPDGRLLESFLSCQDEAAFALLVKRHGRMVLGVCRRIIGNEHDAEDAFQAVFMTLARKAGSIVPRDLVGNWLHGVAYRTALQARGRLGRRRARERQVIDVPEPMAAPLADVQELHQLLDRELEKLPEKHRLPIVLCELEGRPRKEVAGQLKIPEGTLSSRLANGRALLARRLSRHGVTLSSAALAAMLTSQASALQPALVGSTVKAASLVVAGQSAAGVVSAQAIFLCQGALKTMFLKKLKVITVLVIGAMCGGLGMGMTGWPASLTLPTAHAAQEGQAGAPKQAPGSDDEPIDGKLLLDNNVQKELRLSKSQVDKLLAISQGVDAKSSGTQTQIKEIQKQIDELQARIADLNRGIESKRAQIEKQRSQSLAKAAPDILSAKALERLRHIQRQQRSLDSLLQDPKIQHLLKINDETQKKIETILKTEGPRWQILSTMQNLEVRWELPSTVHNNAIWLDNDSMNKLFDTLTPAQQKTLLDWVGNPYQANSWQALQKPDGKAGKR
jgi:RNA polymerase sigma factor (sigma-70 family)